MRKNKMTLAYIKNKSLLKVFVIILPVYLIGCQNNVGNNSGSNSGNNSSRLNRYKPTDDTPSSYQGSQAYNSSLLTNEEVNGQTGTLTLSKPLIVASGITKDIDLNFNLMYASSSSKLKSILGLPKGWSYQISYVIPNKSANIDGRNFIIDDNYNSGLRYVNNHAIKFSSYYDSKQLTCNNDKLDYNYDYRGAQGEHLYFDEAGKLIAKANRFGSCISYYYSDNGSDDIYHSYLDHIVDSYGKTYKFATDVLSGTVTVTDTLAKTIASFSYNDAGVGSYSDAMGYKTNYNYYDNNGLLNSITYPSGLVTNVDYIDIPYSICGGQGQVGYLKAVGEITHQGNNNKVLNKTDYDYNAGSANFTGYQAGGGKCMSPDTDNLADSLDSGFNYSVVITKKGDNSNPDQISSTTYNFIHLPIKQQTLSSSKAILSETDFKYNISSPPSTRSGSYSSPIEIKSIKGGNIVAVENKSYDDYDQETSSQQSVLIKGQLQPYKSVTTDYFPEPAFYLPKTINKKDEVTSTTLDTLNTLDNTSKSIGFSSISYNGSPWKALSYTYDANGRIQNETITWMDGSHPGIKSSNVAYTYNYNNSNGVLTSTKTDAMDHMTTTTSSTSLAGSPVLSVKSPTNKTTNYEYDDDGRELSVTSPGGHVTRTTYNVGAGNNTATKTDPLGYIVEIQYDELARPIKVTDTTNGKSRVIETNSYNTFGKVTSTTDKQGNTTTSKYDEFGRVIQTTDYLNNVTTTTYDDKGLKEDSKLNNNLLSSTITDGAGNKETVIKYAADGSTNNKTVMSYNGFGKVVESTVTINGNLDNTTTYIYNGDGDIIDATKVSSNNTNINAKSQVDLLGNTLHTTTAITNNPSKGTRSSATDTYYLDGSLETTTNNIGQTKTMTYYPDGKLYTVKEYDGSTTTYTYDLDGNISTKSRAGITTTSSYDAVGNLLSITDPNGTIKYTNQSPHLLTSVTYPDGKSISYTYDAKDNLQTKTNVFGVTTTYTTENGRVKAISTPQNTLTYNYADNKLINNTYGMLEGVSLSSNGKIILSHTYTYALWGQIQTDNILQNGHYINNTYSYDWKNRLQKQTLGSDLPDPNLHMQKKFTYDDGLDHLNSVVATYGVNNESSISESYSYDANGNVLSYTKNGIPTLYTYNTIDQLISVDGKIITYDLAGNMLNDADGNTYTYSKVDQLIKVTPKNAVGSNNPTTAYDYYPDGLLSNKTTGSNIIGFYYDDSHVDAITSIKNGISSQSSFLLSSDGTAVASYDNKNISNYFLGSANSTVGMLDGNGNLTNSFNYSGYGSVTAKNETDPSSSFLWNHEYQDPDTNLVFLRSRFYNPKLMHFMNADTVNVENLYNFGNGDPINNIDPSGHIPLLISLMLGEAAVAIFTGGAAVPEEVAADAGMIEAAEVAGGEAIAADQVENVAAAGSGLRAARVLRAARPINPQENVEVLQNTLRTRLESINNEIRSLTALNDLTSIRSRRIFHSLDNLDTGPALRRQFVGRSTPEDKELIKKVSRMNNNMERYNLSKAFRLRTIKELIVEKSNVLKLIYNF